MNNKEFVELHMCTFEPDPRHFELENMLIQYHKDSEHLDYRVAYKLWRELRDCVRHMGFTSDEFNRAKRRVLGMNI